MQTLRRIDAWCTRIAQAILIALFAIMLGLAALQVGLRTFFSTSILWGDTAARHLVIWVGFLGAFLATDGQHHFNIALLPRFLPPRFRHWVERATAFFAGAVSLLMGNASMTFLNVGIEEQSILILNIPARLVAVIVPVGFYLMAGKFFLRTILGYEQGESAIAPKPEGESR